MKNFAFVDNFLLNCTYYAVFARIFPQKAFKKL